jgi:hypothetical protein
MLASVPDHELPKSEPMSHPTPIRIPGGAASLQRHQGPQYVRRNSWFRNFIALVPPRNCATCGAGPYTGWVQRQIENPGRIKRWILWWVNLIPRGASLVRVVTSGLVGVDEFIARQKACADCPGAVVRLKLVKGTIQEKSYCGLCQCPKWWLSRNEIANWFKKRECPLNRHPKQNPNAIYTAYVETKRAGTTRPVPIDREPLPTPAPPPISNCQCDKKSKARGSGKKS